MHAQVKIIGQNGQLSLGKEHAGRAVLVDQLDDGTWMIKSGEFIPDSERWLHQADASDKLNQALSWAEQTEPKDSLEDLAQSIEDK